MTFAGSPPNHRRYISHKLPRISPLGTEKPAPRRVLIAHPFALGDVLSALPIAGMLKRRWPLTEVLFVGTPYSRPLIECCVHVDRYVDLPEMIDTPGALAALEADVFLNPYPDKRLVKRAWQARIPIRVGNLRRIKTIRYCNRFVSYSRAHSDRHTIFINLLCLKPLGFDAAPAAADLSELIGLKAPPLDARLSAELMPDRFNLVLHPKSGGEGREWPLQSYLELARRLPQQRFKIFLTGTAAERLALEQQCPDLLAPELVTSLMGQLTLREFIAFVHRADGFVASGTGPLHIAAALGIPALGIYPPLRDIDPLRWAPIGRRAQYLCLPQCAVAGTCASSPMGPPCPCTAAIEAASVVARVEAWQAGLRRGPEAADSA